MAYGGSLYGRFVRRVKRSPFLEFFEGQFYEILTFFSVIVNTNLALGKSLFSFYSFGIKDISIFAIFLTSVDFKFY